MNPRASLADAYLYARLALEASEKYPAVDPLLLLAIGTVESGYDPQAKSHADARGLYQIWPSTGRLLARSLGWNYDEATLYDPEKNTEAAALYLDILFAAYNDPHMVLAEYNGGPLNAGYYRADVGALAAETRSYVPRVLELYARLKDQFERPVASGASRGDTSARASCWRAHDSVLSRARRSRSARPSARAGPARARAARRRARAATHGTSDVRSQSTYTRGGRFACGSGCRMMRARLGTDLSVALGENRPGMLARAAEAIASGGLNLEGFAEVDGTLHVLTCDPHSGAPRARGRGPRGGRGARGPGGADRGSLGRGSRGVRAPGERGRQRALHLRGFRAPRRDRGRRARAGARGAAALAPAPPALRKPAGPRGAPRPPADRRAA